MPIIAFYSNYFIPLSLFFLIYIVIGKVSFRRKISLSIPWFIVFFLAIGVFILKSFSVIGLLSTYMWFIVILTLIVFLSKSEFLKKKFINQLIIFILFISTINTILYFIFGDFSNRFNGNSIIASMLGFTVERPEFYFSNGVSHYAITLGFCIIIVICWRRDFFNSVPIYNRIISTWIFLHLFMLAFVIDSRGALLGLFFAFFTSRYFGKVKLFNYLLVFLPILIPLLGVYLHLFGKETWIFSRGQSTLFSYREYLWISSFEGISQIKSLNFLFGNGASGYMNYDFGTYIASYFADRQGNNLGSLHNGYLQLFYEFGLIGLLLFISGYFWLMRRLVLSGFMHLTTPLYSYLFFVAGTEAVLSLSYFFILLGTICYSLVLINKSQAQNII